MQKRRMENVDKREEKRRGEEERGEERGEEIGVETKGEERRVDKSGEGSERKGDTGRLQGARITEEKWEKERRRKDEV